MPAIEVRHVSKVFKQYPSTWLRLREWLTPGPINLHRPITVLDDVSFTLNRGEAVGLVGLNGAGKSTLLKILNGTLRPTRGEIQIKGSIAALLELGLGFHGDFSGRENIFIAGQLLGYQRRELTRLIPNIESFAEIGEYLDQPLRTYSSGMQVRLAFSIATAIRPDILIVDEALSVGDSYFQQKSFERIRQFQTMGTTLVLVSHDKNAIQAICDRALLLERGRLIMNDKPEVVMNYYNALLAQKNHAGEIVQVQHGNRVMMRSGSGAVQIVSIQLCDVNNRPIEVVHVGQSVHLDIEVCAQQSVSDLVVGYLIKDRLGQSMFGTNTNHAHYPIAPLAPNEQFQLRLSFALNLGVGHYSISVALHQTDSHVHNNFAWHDGALQFEVINSQHSHFDGVAWLPPTISQYAKR